MFLTLVIVALLLENIALSGDYMFLDYKLDLTEDSVWKIAQPTVSVDQNPFVMNEAGLFHAQSEYYTNRSGKMDYQLIYTVAGCGEMEYLGEKWLIPEGSFIIIDCSLHHEYHTRAGEVDGWTFYWIHANGVFAKKYYDLFQKNGYNILMVGKDYELTNIFKELINLIDYPNESAYCVISGYIGAIYSKIIQLSSMSKDSEVSHESDMKKAVEYIQSNYTGDIDMGSLSKHFNLSKYYFVRLFKKHIGITPYNYVIMYRIAQAKKMLRASDYKINDICRLVGFTDESNFNRTFKKVVGIPPAKYRNDWPGGAGSRKGELQ